MMTPILHEPALCHLLACPRCDDYGDGYAAGKDKAHFELRTWELGAHAPGCGCEPCETVRVIVRKAGNFALGKAKVHVDLGTWELGAHVPGCDCEPCETIRVVVRKVVGAPQELVLLESHIEDREVVCEGCTCWCHGIEP